jgi:hypothetical protein
LNANKKSDFIVPPLPTELYLILVEPGQQAMFINNSQYSVEATEAVRTLCLGGRIRREVGLAHFIRHTHILTKLYHGQLEYASKLDEPCILSPMHGCAIMKSLPVNGLAKRRTQYTTDNKIRLGSGRRGLYLRTGWRDVQKIAATAPHLRDSRSKNGSWTEFRTIGYMAVKAG